MKKTFAFILALAVVLSLSAAAFAAGPDNGPGSSAQQMPGHFQQDHAPGGMQEKGGLPPMMNGESPDMNCPPHESFGQTSDGESPADLPELPDMSSEAASKNGRPQLMNDRTPAFIVFDAMATDGVISQETLKKIKTYMEENKPSDLPEPDGAAPEAASQPPEMNGQAPNGEKPEDLPERPEINGEAPTELPERPEMNGDASVFDGDDSMKNGLLNDLLDAGVISQAEYEALCEAAAE